MKFHPVDPRRLTVLRPGAPGNGPVVYWMSRDQRVSDNWALLHAQNEALKKGRPLAVVFCLSPRFGEASLRQYDFMLGGLRAVEPALKRLNIAFLLFTGDPATTLPRELKRLDPALVVCDFDPLREKVAWRAAVVAAMTCPVVEVDAHNIVPARTASPKKEYAAATFRPKVNRLLAEFLVPFPKLNKHPHPFAAAPVDWDDIAAAVKAAPAGSPLTITPGEKAAWKQLERFLKSGLARYGDRNDPTADATSGLSPYLHFGQISAQAVSLAVRDYPAPTAAVEAFLEQLIVRRELADNLCLYEPHYDSFDGIPAWAQKTLNDHRADKRLYHYDSAAWETAATHDDLWNTAQREILATGALHGYLRMYWAKKILEWSATPEEAIATAVRLNDRYALDGRDPNGYAGILWSIGGLHDRPWFTRPVFGAVRFMGGTAFRNRPGMRGYIKKWSHLSLFS
ncbi:MAG TPA: deoxyribodipyrimidine photo-lyase [bacterium]|nr:deoxyribodipyrimidine photo-lyase [bacterium]